MSTSLKILVLGGAMALLAGCGRPFVAATPQGFVDLGEKYPEDEYRATTADGVILAARALDNDPKGPLEFWTRTVERRMREMGGYALLTKREVAARGLRGTSFRFGHDEGKEPYLYDLTLFVSGDKIFLLEAGGPKAEMLKQQAQLDAFVGGFRKK